MAQTTGRRVVRTGARGVAVGTAAIAVLSVLQQAIGAFNPRPSMSATIVAAVAFASFVTKGLADRRREDREAAELRRLLVVWPPRPLSEVDPVHLGAFPSRRDLGAAPPYVPRTLDPDLREALQEGSVVLVHGPHLAGKTRTAVEVARTALADAHVIAPRSPDALAELLALDAAIDAGGGERVVWLDDLGRFTEMLDPATLDEVRQLGAPASLARDAPPVPPAGVIATIRTEDWDALRSASGPEGRGARAVAAVARSFQLPAGLTDDELASAHERYPDVTFEDGIGPALASTGTEGMAPPSAPAPAREAPRRHPLRDVQLAVPAALTIAAVTAAGLIWGFAGFSTPTPPPIADQIAKIKRAASRDGRLATTPTGVDPLNLHGTGAASYFFIVKDRPGSGLAPRADEVRVYDDDGGYLTRRLTFEPREPGSGFQFERAADVDFDGATEIVGGYSRPDARNALVPFAIDFDDNDLYKIVPLSLGPPRLANLRLERRFRIPTRQYRPVYAEPVAFSDRNSPTTLRGLRVQNFIVTAPNWRLVAGYFVQAPPSSSDLAVYELHAGVFDARSGAPRVRLCELDHGTVPRASLRLDRRDERRAIEESWTAASAKRQCALAA
jgi:hypothetical protein